MPELHPAQFANQMALPGMEHMAHPWAGPLSKGYVLKYGSDEAGGAPGKTGRHQLQAVSSFSGVPDAYLEWGSRHANDAVKGEIHMIKNYEAGQEHGRGMAGALMRSGHHFDFGQDTFPVHSMDRTPQGKDFSDRVMPELKPTIWRNPHNMHVTREDTGEPATGSDIRNVSWPGVHETFHPYQRKALESERMAAQSAIKPRSPRGQGRLF